MKMETLKKEVHKFFYRCAWDKKIFHRLTNNEVKPRKLAEFYNKLIESDGLCPSCLQKGLSELKKGKK